MVTIGYGVNDQFFNECPEGIFIIGIQSLIGRFLDAAIMGATLLRLARGTSRGHSIIFSDKAFVRVKRGSLYVSVQICDLRKHQLLEAHVRVFAIRHVYPEDVIENVNTLQGAPFAPKGKPSVRSVRNSLSANTPKQATSNQDSDSSQREPIWCVRITSTEFICNSLLALQRMQLQVPACSYACLAP